MMPYMHGLYTFGVLLAGYIYFISAMMGIAPWKLWSYDSRTEKKSRD